MPSDTVVLINAVPDKKNIQTAPLEAKSPLLQRGRYKDVGLQPVKIDPKDILEMNVDLTMVGGRIVYERKPR
mgnify:CR=1 FL=1